MASLRKPLLLALAGAAVWAAATPSARAEVYALLNPDGSFNSIRITRVDARGSVWTSLGIAESRRLVLNPGGDRRGDGAPVIVPDPVTGLPFAAWSTRSVTGQRDIQVAAFTGREWVLYPQIGLAGGDDFEPDLMILPGVIVTAWTHGRNSSSVWVSMHASALPDGRPDPGWLVPAPIRGGERAHSPRLTVDARGRLIVQSVGRGRPAIQDDVLSLSTVDATDGPMPLPPGIFPFPVDDDDDHRTRKEE